MKKIFPLILITAISIIACKKNGFGITDRTAPPAGAALVKIANVSAPTTAPNVLVYLNGTRVSYPLGFNTPFPGGGLGTGGSNNSDYMIVTPGTTKVELNVPNPGTPVIAYKLFETTQNFEGGKRQILFISDTAANMTAWNVNVDGSAPDSGFAKIQFVNAIPNSGPLDLYRGLNSNVATLVVGDIKYKDASAYIPVPFGGDSLFLRPSGTPVTTAPFARVRITTSLANQRLYTIYARGYIGGTGTNKAPNLSAIINQ
jgi:hypothetical protein